MHQPNHSEDSEKVARGVAHELNNFLNVYLLNCKAILRTDDLPDEARQRIEKLIRFSENLTHFTQQLQAYTGRLFLQPEPFDIRSGIDTAIQALLDEEQIPSSRFKVEAPDRLEVWAEPTVFPMALKSLLLNAIEGTESEDASVTVRLEEMGDQAKLAIENPGPAPSADALEQWGTPFFSTRDKGRGSGLNFAAAAGLIRQLEGTLEFDYRDGRFVVEVTLPRVQD